jgi:hypothetical protein
MKLMAAISTNFTETTRKILKERLDAAYQNLWWCAVALREFEPGDESTPELRIAANQLLAAAELYTVTKGAALADEPLLNARCPVCDKYLGLVIYGLYLQCPICQEEGHYWPMDEIEVVQ